VEIKRPELPALLLLPFSPGWYDIWGQGKCTLYQGCSHLVISFVCIPRINMPSKYVSIHECGHGKLLFGNDYLEWSNIQFLSVLQPASTSETNPHYSARWVFRRDPTATSPTPVCCGSTYFVVRFEVFTAVKIQDEVFRVVTP
jgi:hypothetical protein